MKYVFIMLIVLLVPFIFNYFSKVDNLITLRDTIERMRINKIEADILNNRYYEAILHLKSIDACARENLNLSKSDIEGMLNYLIFISQSCGINREHLAIIFADFCFMYAVKLYPDLKKEKCYIWNIKDRCYKNFGPFYPVNKNLESLEDWKNFIETQCIRELGQNK